MAKLSGVPHLRAVRALEKAGFKVAREGARHIVMSKMTGVALSVPIGALKRSRSRTDLDIARDRSRARSALAKLPQCLQVPLDRLANLGGRTFRPSRASRAL